MDAGVLYEQIRETLGASPHPLSARELGPRVEADPYELRSALNHMRRLGELSAAMGEDNETLVYRMRPDEEPPQPMQGLTTRKNGHHTNGSSPHNGKPAVDVKAELLAVIEGLCEGQHAGSCTALRPRVVRFQRFLPEVI